MNDRAEGKIETRHHAERSIVLESLLLAAVALLVLNFHPFGSAHLRRHFSQDLIYAWFGDAEWLYPRHPTASRQDARAVVMLVDDAALAARGARWPVPIGFHAQLLAEVGVLRPRAIMLDFLLMDNASSGDICSLLETAARLRAAGTSLYLAMTTQQDLAAPAHASCAGPGGQRLDPSRLFVPVSVSRQVDEADFASRRYPFADSASDERGSSGVASAAVRIYCDLSSDSPGCETRLTRGLTPDAGFELAWSPSGDPFNARWSRSPCRSAATLRTLLDRTVLPRILACPPVATLFASELLNPAEDQNLGSDNETLFALMQGSVVFIGGNFRAGGDLVTTPLHTFLPGVYYHAMAFQNLETFAGEPKVREEFRSFKIGIFVYDLLVLWALAAIFVWRERRNRGGAPVTHHGSFAPSDSASDWFAGAFARLPVAVSLGVFVAVAVLLAAYPRVQLAVFLAAAAVVIGVEIVASSRFEFRRLLRSAGLYALALGLSLGVVALAVWFGYRWLRLPPGDWVGYLSFSTVGFFVAHTAVVDFGRRIGSIRRGPAV